MNILGLSIGLALLAAIVLLLILVFEVWMFVDAIRNPKLSDNERLLWCAGMIFIHPFVAIAYYLLAYSKRDDR